MNAIDDALIDHLERLSDIRGADHTDCDGFTVAIFLIIGLLLERVRNGVTEVENAAEPALLLVLADDVGFNLAGAGDDVFERVIVERENLIGVSFEITKKIGVRYHAVFDDFPESRGNLARRQCLQKIEVGKDGARLIESADEIFAERVINGDLASDGGVDLSEQRGRDLNERHAAEESSGDEAGKIADDASSEREDRRLSIELTFDGGGINFIGGLETFGGFALRDGDHIRVQARRADQIFDLRSEVAADVFIGDDQSFAGEFFVGDKIFERFLEMIADKNLIRIGSEVDVNDFHISLLLTNLMMLSTSSSGDQSVVSRV